MGRPSLLDEPDPDLWAKWRYMLAKGSGLDLDEMRAEAGPTAATPGSGVVLDLQVQTDDGRLDCCPALFWTAIERCHALFDEAQAEVTDGRLRLINKRAPWTHNSWFANVASMKRGGRTTNPLSMHPDDAAARGLTDCAGAVVTSDHGAIESTVELDAEPVAGRRLHGPRLAARGHAPAGGGPCPPGRQPQRAPAVRRRELRPAVGRGPHDGHPVAVRPIVDAPAVSER